MEMTAAGSSGSSRRGGSAAPRHERRSEIVRTLRGRTSASAVELADLLGVHPNTIRFHLGVLERSGAVVREQSVTQTPGRPELRFRLPPAQTSAGVRADLLARILLTRIAAGDDPEIEAEKAGHQWGSDEAVRSGRTGSDAVAGLLDVLESSGFAPSAGEGAAIDLHNCPLREFLDPYGRLVCAVHSGLMTGFLDAAQSPCTVDSLVPFASATTCRAHLQQR